MNVLESHALRPDSKVKLGKVEVLLNTVLAELHKQTAKTQQLEERLAGTHGIEMAASLLDEHPYAEQLHASPRPVIFIVSTYGVGDPPHSALEFASWLRAGGLEPGTIAPRLAALAIAGTILANMSVKLGVTLAYGVLLIFAALCVAIILFQKREVG